MAEQSFRRVLLKLSGEALSGTQGSGMDDSYMMNLAQIFRRVVHSGVQLGIVVGGGNFWRGRSSGEMDRVTADHIGMLATTMNALALADVLERVGVPACVQAAVPMPAFAESFDHKSAIRHMEAGRVVVFSAGTGNPFFSTDSGAALRAIQIGADVLLKATLVDGIYDSDPHKNPDAKLLPFLTHDEVLRKQLGVMDATAAALCRENHMDIRVFSIQDPENLYRMVTGSQMGTLVSDHLPQAGE